MTPRSLSQETDAQLVAASLAGDRDAFGRIVARYQALVCALAFSATGSVSRSEDLAQETFITAWRQLAGLREPERLRAWLCGMARNLIHAELRRLGREPVHGASALSEIAGLPAAEPAPATQAITNEEAALLWREVGSLPETYREVLVLYYRDQRSVAAVADALDLKEDAVMQRLSRGRRLLQERMVGFVEEALARSNPDRQFYLGVQAALPALAAGAQVASIGSLPSLTLKGGAGLSALLLPFVGLFAAFGVSWTSVRTTPAGAERRFIRRWHLSLWGIIAFLLLGLAGLGALADARDWPPDLRLRNQTFLWFAYLLALATLIVILYRRGDGAEQAAPPRQATLMLAGTYLATTAWLIGLAAVTGDTATALVLAAATAGLGLANHRANRQRPAASAHRTNLAFHAVLCAVLLLAANVRVAHWLAPLHRVSVPEMEALLSLPRIHALTVGLVIWTALLLRLSRPHATGR